jgi:hypothetical protein
MIFGDSIYMIQSKGQPSDYEALGFITWDPTAEQYQSVAISNMGEIHLSTGIWVGDQLILNHHTTQAGQPLLARNLLQVDESGNLLHTAVDSISSADKPARVFEASYKKK